jgi:predicted dinucleotide-binding enzyme
MIGSRTPESEKLSAWRDGTGEHASTGTFEEAAAFGEVIILATLWSGTQHALELAGAPNLAGKVVLDATNPLDFSSGKPALALGHTDSGGEQIQRWIPAARVVKVFNTVGNAHMVNPDFPCGPPDMFICGNDAEAKATATDICRQLGWPGTIDIGGIEGSRLLEPLCILWVDFGMLTNSWNHAFKMLLK